MMSSSYKEPRIHGGNTLCLPREQHFQTEVLLHIYVEEEIKLVYSFRTALIGFYNCSLKGGMCEFTCASVTGIVRREGEGRYEACGCKDKSRSDGIPQKGSLKLHSLLMTIKC